MPSGAKLEADQLTVDGPEAEALYREGQPLRLLALRYGVSKEAVRRVLLRRGVAMRPRGGNQGNHSRHRR